MSIENDFKNPKKEGEVSDILKLFSPELRTANVSLEDIKSGKALLHVVNGIVMGIQGMKETLNPEKAKRLISLFKECPEVDASFIEEEKLRKMAEELNAMIRKYNRIIREGKENEKMEGGELLEKMKSSWEYFEKIQKELLVIFGHYLSKAKNDEGLLGR